MNHSEPPEIGGQNEPDSPSAMDIACFRGAVIGAVVALLLAVVAIGLLALAEKINYGSVSWDKAVGIGFLPIIAVPIGAVLGTLIGMVWASIRR